MISTFLFSIQIIGTVITNTEKKIIFEEILMPGYNGNSPFVVFNQFRNQATNQPIRTDSLPNMEMNVWYKEDLTGQTEHDNSGIHEIKVYVTIEADADKQFTRSSRTGLGKVFLITEGVQKSVNHFLLRQQRNKPLIMPLKIHLINNCVTLLTAITF